MHTNLLVDLNNIVFSTRFAKVKTPSRNARKESFVKELIFKEVVNQIVFFALEFKADSIVVTRDAPNVWRKDIHPTYKGNREHNDVYYQETIDAADMCSEFFRTCTNVGVLEVPRAEADDIIAVFCQESIGVKNIILSSDKDFKQLLVDENTQLYSPPQKAFRECEDVGYELFLKCIRGDTNDNIRSAFPRVYETKVKAAWEDDYEMLNLLETVRKDGQKVADVFDFNRSLIDLSSQPIDIRNQIVHEITTGNHKNFGEMKMMAWFGKNNLKEFADMLMYKERPLRGHYVFKADK